MPCEDTDGVSVVDEYPLHAVAKLLGIEDEVQLTEALISNVNHIKGNHSLQSICVLINPHVTNGLSHPYHWVSPLSF